MDSDDSEIEPRTDSEVARNESDVDSIREGLLGKFSEDKKAKYRRFIAAAALGSIPWVGGVLSAAIALQAEAAKKNLMKCKSFGYASTKNSGAAPQCWQITRSSTLSAAVRPVMKTPFQLVLRRRLA
jgi:hypothetical protein